MASGASGWQSGYAAGSSVASVQLMAVPDLRAVAAPLGMRGAVAIENRQATIVMTAAMRTRRRALTCKNNLRGPGRGASGVHGAGFRPYVTSISRPGTLTRTDAGCYRAANRDDRPRRTDEEVPSVFGKRCGVETNLKRSGRPRARHPLLERRQLEERGSMRLRMALGGGTL